MARTYTLVSGTGDDDNASFEISGDQLLSKEVFDYDTKSSYSVRVKTDDGRGGVLEQALTINVDEIPVAPTDMSLSSLTIDENLSIGTVVGTFSTTDENAGNTHTYTLVSGAGDGDNASFSIDGSDLLSGEMFDFETKSSYNIRVRTTDSDLLTYEEAFVISINDALDPPTDISIDSSTVNENLSIGSSVGTFSSTDQDGGSHVYTLVAGTGDDDNGSFTISGAVLETNAIFDFETKSSYTIRVRSTDNGFVEKVFAITILDANDAPTDITLDSLTVLEAESIGTIVGGLTTTDVDAGDSHTYTLVAGVGSTDNGSFSISGSNLLTNAVFDFDVKTSYDIRIQSDDGAGGIYQEAFTITILDFIEPATVITVTNTNVSAGVPTPTNFVASYLMTDGTVPASDAGAYTLVAGVGDDDNAIFSIGPSNEEPFLASTGQSYARLKILGSKVGFNFGGVTVGGSATCRIAFNDGVNPPLEQVFVFTFVAAAGPFIADVQETNTTWVGAADDIDITISSGGQTNAFTAVDYMGAQNANEEWKANGVNAIEVTEALDDVLGHVVPLGTYRILSWEGGSEGRMVMAVDPLNGGFPDFGEAVDYVAPTHNGQIEARWIS
jgi:hypothetical protein|tara:strand:- start:5636 stop:7468 length:1833 start_codon:yes stop_codon:yes gene_type:complete